MSDGGGNRLTWIDTHAHLSDRRLVSRLGEVLSSAAEAGVEQIVAIGTTLDDSVEVGKLAGRLGGVFAAVGIHPNHAAEAGEGDWEQIVRLAREARVVAIGETGLDRYWDHTPFAMQQEYFERHLALGRERGLPVVIHCRDCESDIIAQLERFGPPVRGVLHSFTGSGDDADAFLALGLHISFAGMVTYTSAKSDPLREVAARIPSERLLIETDSPYLSPHPFRGKTNEPARVVETARVLAWVRGVELEQIARETTANARRLFGLDGADGLVARA
jgi:TatD DNase family protein